MSLLLDPDIGEILDRLSILELKIDAGMKRSVSTERWEEEKRQLDVYLQKKILTWQRTVTSANMERFGTLNTQLYAINARLWRAEDEIRIFVKRASDLTDTEKESVVLIAIRIASLNDARSEAIRGINRLFGVDTQEKIYVQ